MQTINAQTGEGTSKTKVKQIHRLPKEKNKNKISSEVLRAQSGEGKPTHFEGVTRFYDESVVHKPSQEERQAATGIPRQVKQGVDIDLMNFMTRPCVLDTYTWAASRTIRFNLFNLDLPELIRDKSETLKDKLHNIAWYAPDIELEIQINATKFHYGRLMIVVKPFSYLLADAYNAAEGASSWPEWYQISPNSQQSLKITIPYRHIVRRVPIAGDYTEFNNWVRVSGYVAAPLRAANTATPPDVTITVYGRLINPSYSSMSALFAHSGEQKSEILQMLSDNVTSLLPNQPGVISAPITTSFNAVSSVTKDIARLTAVAGLSIPTNPAPTMSMQVRQPLFSKSNDMPNTVNLGPSQTSALETNYALCNATEDDMNIVNIVGHPSLIYTGQINSTDAPGTILHQNFLNPVRMFYGDYGFTDATRTLQPTPMYYIARMFTNWRGSFKFHVSFISSSFHSCRVRFLWNPYLLDSDNRAFTVAEETSTYNILMDINQQTDYSILVPYDQCVEWLKVHNGSGANPSYDWANGFFQLKLCTHLTASNDVVQPIYYQIFVSMADDAQFAAPNLERLNIYGNPYVAEPAALREDDNDVVTVEDILNDLQDEGLVAQEASIAECDVPSSSSLCLRNTEYVNIMGGKLDTRRVYGEATVFEFTSVKQLSNMLSPMEKFKTVVGTNYVGRQVNPFGTIKFAFTDDQWFCFYNQIRSIYRFGRGSFRFVGITSGSSIQATSYLRPGIDNTASYWTTVTTDPFIGTVGASVVPGGFQYFMSTMYMPADITIPYYSTVPCIVYNSTQIVPSPFFNTSSAANIVFSNQGTANLSIMYFGATSDDFIFGTRTGMPKLKWPAP